MKEKLTNMISNVFAINQKGVEFYFEFTDQYVLRKICLQVKLKLKDRNDKNIENLFCSLAKTHEGIRFLESSSLIKDLLGKIMTNEYPMD